AERRSGRKTDANGAYDLATRNETRGHGPERSRMAGGGGGGRAHGYGQAAWAVILCVFDAFDSHFHGIAAAPRVASQLADQVNAFADACSFGPHVEAECRHRLARHLEEELEMPLQVACVAHDGVGNGDTRRWIGLAARLEEH